MDALFSEFDKENSPGCAVAVYRNGNTVFSRGYGLANLDTGTRITPSTVFHTASVSKQFTAFAVALLAQEAALSLDAQISTYLSDLPAAAQRITVRQLIHHTSGLRDEFELLWMSGWRNEGDVKTLNDALSIINRQQSLNYDPGSEHLYVNSGYTLLAEIVRRVSGQSLRSFAEEKIFRPLGMSNTQFIDDSREVVPNRASPYAPSGQGEHKIAQRRFDYVGAMGVHTNVEDLAKWELNFISGQVGGYALLKMIQQPGRLSNSQPLSYAFGLHADEYRGFKAVHHDGIDPGYRSTFLRFPDQNIAVATLCNTSSAISSRLARSVADLYLPAQGIRPSPSAFPEAPRLALKETELQKFAGIYLNRTTGFIFRITPREGDLIYQTVGSDAEGTKLMPIGPNRFATPTRSAVVTFTMTPAGKPTQMVISRPDGGSQVIDFGGREQAAARFSDYVGTYRSAELGTQWAVRVRGNQLLFEVPRNGDIEAIPADRDAFGSLAPRGFYLKFERDRRGRITGFRVFQPRVRGLYFSRS